MGYLYLEKKAPNWDLVFVGFEVSFLELNSAGVRIYGLSQVSCPDVENFSG